MARTIMDQKIEDIKEDMQEVKRKVDALDRKTWLMLVALALLAADTAPQLVGTVMAWTK